MIRNFGRSINLHLEQEKEHRATLGWLNRASVRTGASYLHSTVFFGQSFHCFHFSTGCFHFLLLLLPRPEHGSCSLFSPHHSPQCAIAHQQTARERRRLRLQNTHFSLNKFRNTLTSQNFHKKQFYSSLSASCRNRLTKISVFFHDASDKQRMFTRL